MTVGQPQLVAPATSGVHNSAYVPDEVDWDTYYTPLVVAQALVECLPIRDGDMVCDPSAGSGAWLEAVRRRHRRTQRGAIDIDPTAPALQAGADQVHWRHTGDFLTWRPREWTAAPHWFVGNPPYSGATEHIRHALSVVRLGGSVAMLLGVGILSGQQRWTEVYRTWRPRLIVHLPKRIAFCGRARDGAVLDGRSTGSRDNVFVWWDTGWTGPTFAAWLDPETNRVEPGFTQRSST